MKKSAAKSILIILIALLCGAKASTAQIACELAAKPAPLLLNLQTGMSPEQVQAVFGSALKIKAGKKGESTIFRNYVEKPAPAPLGGIRALYLRFFDRRLYQIEIFYEPRPDLPALDSIVSQLSAQLNLPVAGWQRHADRSEIICGSLALITDNLLNPRVQLTDEKVRLTAENARPKS